MSEDPRVGAARRLRDIDERRRPDGVDPEEVAQRGPDTIYSDADVLRAAKVESSVQRAINRGDFDDLPGSGKPLKGLDGPYDPDWWIRDKIEKEQLEGLGPSAFTLRREDAALEATLDTLAREQDVREHLEDFNRRVIEARRQLAGGPPVVTPTRDVSAEVAAWKRRREAQASAAAEGAASDTERDTGEVARDRRGWLHPWRRRRG